MAVSVAPLIMDAYLEKMYKISAQCEEKNNKITKGEKEKFELEQQVKQLQSVKHDLESQKYNSVLTVGKLKTDIYELSEEIKCINQLENEYKICRKNEDAKLWDLSQKVYSEIIVYCDKVQEFVDNYKFLEMINKIVYLGSSEMTFSNTVKDKKQKELERLKKIKEDLTEELTALNNNQMFVKEALEKKANLKHWPLEGKEFLDLQAAITKSKEESIKLHHDISELESKRTKCLLKESKVTNLNNNNDTFMSCNTIKTEKDKIVKINNWIKDASSSCSYKNDSFTSSNMKRGNAIHFVPKVVKHFKPSNSS